MSNKKKVREKYWDEKRPAYDLDRVEVQVYLPESELDSFLRQHAQSFVKWAEMDMSDVMRNRRRYDKLMYKIFKAAASCLTDRQFQIFILRYKCLFKEVEIARQVGVNQPYVSTVLKICHSKIRRVLRLESSKRRGPRKRKKTTKNTPKKRIKRRGKGRSKNTHKRRIKKRS